MSEITIDEENREAVEILRRLEQDWFKTLLILWGVWVGKTYLVKSILAHDYFIDEPTFKQHIVAGNARLMKPEEFGVSVKSYPLEALSKCQSVIYDDLWTVELSEAYIEKTLYWINERSKSKNKRTVITTNLTIQELETRERRIFSRLCENAVILQMLWKDRRKNTTRTLRA
jgi:DNA replication protein DnaC